MSVEAFKRQIYKHDTLFLCEAWLHKENINNLSHPNGYLCNFLFGNKRRKKSHPSGGTLVYFHSELKKEVSIFDKSNENILWIKRGKHSMKNKSNTYIACVYNSSTKNSSTLRKMNAIFSSFKFLQSHQIIIGRDFNRRISTKRTL